MTVSFNCSNCGAETSNGLVLCERCRAAAAVALEFIPTYFANLARWKPGRAGSRPVPGSREPRVDGAGRDHGVIRALDQASAALNDWVRRFLHDREPDTCPWGATEATRTTAICSWLSDHLTGIGTLEWCGEFVRDMLKNERQLRSWTERVAPGWYAGACSRCGGSTYVVPGLTWVTCRTVTQWDDKGKPTRRCGLTTYARDHLDIVLDEARASVMTPKRVAEAIVALVDSELSVQSLYDRIRQWASRGDLTPIRRLTRDHVWDDAHDRLIVADVETGPARYRFGDVLDMIARDTRRKHNRRAS